MPTVNFISEPIECPAFTVEGSTQGNWTDSQTGTIVTIQCAVTYALVGAEILTCQESGSWSSDVPQCVKNGKFI